MKFPITTVHQIEISSKCNLKCRYCPHPKMERPKKDMEWDVFSHSIAWAKELGGPELSFTGMGEALLNPKCSGFITYARLQLPEPYFLLATNGLEIVKPQVQDIEVMLRTLRECDVTVFVSTHRPEVAGPALEILLKNGIKAGTNTSFVTSGFDWAGQVEWHGNPAPGTECQYLKQGWATILENGDIVNCCMDAHGLYPVGNVLNSILPTDFEVIPLCEKCHLRIPS